MMNNEILTKPNGNEHDDFKNNIGGLGESYEKALYEIGINSFSDLALHNPETLSRQLNELPGVKEKLEKIKDRIEHADWISQAIKLAGLSEAKRIPPKRNAKTHKAHASTPPSSENDYKEHDYFCVKFLKMEGEQGKEHWRTEVTHDDPEKMSPPFDGIEPAHWVNWIIDKADLGIQHIPKQAEYSKKTAEAETKAEEKEAEPSRLGLEIEIQNIDIKPTSDAPKKMITVDIRFKVSGDKAGELLINKAPFQVEAHMTNLQTGASEFAGLVRNQLEPEKLEYTADIEFPVPWDLGRYELQTFVFLLPPYKGTFFKEGCTFKVVS